MPAKAEKRADSAKNVASAVQARPPLKGDHVFLVDGSSYIFRAYHALPPLHRKSDGLQVNAVLGFCNMLWKLLRDMKPEERPTHLAVVFDKSEKTFRTEMYSEYKANRTEPPDDHRRLRQGSDAARERLRRHVRHHEGPQDRHPRGDREVWSAPAEDDRGAGSDRGFERQRAG